MYNALLYKITKSKDGKYKVYLNVDYHDTEEEAVFRFNSLREMPRYLFRINKGKIVYAKNAPVLVSHPFEDANGIVFLCIYESKRD